MFCKSYVWSLYGSRSLICGIDCYTLITQHEFEWTTYFSLSNGPLIDGWSYKEQRIWNNIWLLWKIWGIHLISTNSMRPDKYWKYFGEITSTSWYACRITTCLNPKSFQNTIKSRKFCDSFTKKFWISHSRTYYSNSPLTVLFILVCSDPN